MSKHCGEWRTPLNDDNLLFFSLNLQESTFQTFIFRIMLWPAYLWKSHWKVRLRACKRIEWYSTFNFKRPNFHLISKKKNTVPQNFAFLLQATRPLLMCSRSLITKIIMKVFCFAHSSEILLSMWFLAFYST